MKCDGCKAEIDPVHSEWGNAEETNRDAFQGSAALHLRIRCGYGEFFDRPEFDLIFCHTCGHAIFSLFPQLVEAHRGAHSLREGEGMVDAMCWGLLPSENGQHAVIYGDGKIEEPDS